jgi:DNA end-binding protein Ku
LVNVPVKLYTAVSLKEVRFHMVHDADGARIKQKRICSQDGKEVPYEHIAKGYEISRGHYVVITREELEKLDPKATRTIDIEEFVRLEEIDPIYYQSSHYLAPAQGAARAYALLLNAMTEANRVGIAHVVLRTKQYLCAVRPLDGVLSLSTMLYADEIVSPSQLEDLPSQQPKPKERELAMAEQLIESLSNEFEPTKYKDEYREKVLELIKAKAEGRKMVTAAPERPPAKVVDLMEALKASLAGAQRQGPKAAATAPRPQATRRTGHKRKKASA